MDDKWILPKSVMIDGKSIKIRDACDYRMVLDVISVLNDDELDDYAKAKCALFIFYENAEEITDFQTAINEMIKIINCGEEITVKEPPKPKIMDWEHDYKNLAAPVSRILGYSVRDSKNYTHWYDFVGAYGEIGDCYFAHVISVRSKLYMCKKLDESDRQFYKEHKKDIDLPMKLGQAEEEWLEGEQVIFNGGE